MMSGGLLYGAHLKECDRAAQLRRLPGGLAPGEPAAYDGYVRHEIAFMAGQNAFVEVSFYDKRNGFRGSVSTRRLRSLESNYNRVS